MFSYVIWKFWSWKVEKEVARNTFPHFELDINFVSEIESYRYLQTVQDNTSPQHTSIGTCIVSQFGGKSGPQIPQTRK